jgi:hypothetical protein
MKRVFAVFLIATVCFSVSGCAWMGRTAGKAKAKIERKAGEMDRAYHEGYAGEKKKSTPASPKSEPNPDESGRSEGSAPETTI